MLVRHLMDALEPEAFEACMLVPMPGITDFRWLLTRLAQQLDVETPAGDLQGVLAQVYEQLAVVREDGRSAVLIIDEAQVLADRGLLADLRGLLNLEYEDKRLLTIVLVGAPALLDALRAEPALADRIDLKLALPCLATKEVAPYLHHRIRAAGGNAAILESGAVAALTKLSEGLPRRINALADAALYEAHLAGRVSATAADVEHAAAELGIGQGAESEPAAAEAPAPAPRASASSIAHAAQAAPRAAAPAAAAKGSFAQELESVFEEVELELGDVVAEPTDRPASTTLALFDDPATAEAAFGAPGSQGGFDDSGELEDLFADIVDE
jgi:type II secretory pathway predicted ATPase ExeA